MDERQVSQKLMDKYNDLLEYLRSLKSVAVAFSSGVDSTFLLYAAKEALKDNVLAVTASSGSYPQRELTEAKEYCKQIQVPQVICVTEELKIEGFAQNPENRCYLCKREIFSRIIQTAQEHRMAEVVEGSNLDDDGDYRPGHIAIAELGVKSPLRHCNMSKMDIRLLSRYFQIPTWNKQSFACLATRFPYGELITAEKLQMVDQAEQLLLDLGFHQLRVRIHGMMARIELLPEEFDRFMQNEIRTQVYDTFKAIGFTYVSLDLGGYRTGSMNEMIKNNGK